MPIEPIVMAPSSGTADRWKTAAKAVEHGNSALSRFKTLRDMQLDSYIPPRELQPIKKLGEGAFASVELAWYTAGPETKLMVAVKRLKPEMTSRPEDMRMFAGEAALMRKLKHKHIVDLVGIGQLEDANAQEAYMVQEYMGGGTIHQLVVKDMMANGRRHAYTLVDALDMCFQIAQGLNYLHTAIPMVIHRDLKLENVLLKYAEKMDGHWLVKLADFGLSKKVDTRMEKHHLLRTRSSLLKQPPQLSAMEKSWSARLDDAITRRPSSRTSSSWSAGVGSVTTKGTNISGAEPPAQFTGQTGSYMYMAPEVFREEQYNEKADVFSFGMILYQLVQRYLTIMAISIKGDPEEVIAYAGKVATGYRPPINSKLPPCVIKLIQDCWAQEPASRPSMAEVVQRLQQCIQEVQEDAQYQSAKPACGCVIA